LSYAPVENRKIIETLGSLSSEKSDLLHESISISVNPAYAPFRQPLGIQDNRSFL